MSFESLLHEFCVSNIVVTFKFSHVQTAAYRNITYKLERLYKRDLRGPYSERRRRVRCLFRKPRVASGETFPVLGNTGTPLITALCPLQDV